ncbi:hypothetical protein Q5H93_13495 [Hymenobacter sp. ASUV-10]|uniref:Uncharacterized protein n=1 Tax=Hymenobacter aranciens TaxID=3063996 RepID=A0ABT9BBW8_9BACT|nr:hypothetical protein [Hymenobacter sp. ASUV-10]
MEKNAARAAFLGRVGPGGGRGFVLSQPGIFNFRSLVWLAPSFGSGFLFFGIEEKFSASFTWKNRLKILRLLF